MRYPESCYLVFVRVLVCVSGNRAAVMPFCVSNLCKLGLGRRRKSKYRRKCMAVSWRLEREIVSLYDALWIANACM